MPRIFVLESYLPLAQAIAELLRRAGWHVAAGQMTRGALQPRFKGSWLPAGIFGWAQRTD